MAGVRLNKTLICLLILGCLTCDPAMCEPDNPQVSDEIANELRKAVANDDGARLKELIQNIPDFRFVHLGLPGMAVLYDNLNVLKVLLESGIDIDEGDPRYRVTALHLAAYYNSREACKMLARAGANQFIKNGALQTPVEVAEARGAKECLSELRK